MAVEELLRVKLLENEEHLLSHETLSNLFLARKLPINSVNSLLLELAQVTDKFSCRQLKGTLVEAYKVWIYFTALISVWGSTTSSTEGVPWQFAWNCV